MNPNSLTVKTYPATSIAIVKMIAIHISAVLLFQRSMIGVRTLEKIVTILANGTT